MPDSNSDSTIISQMKEVGGVFKLGSGVLGKSAIAIGILMVAGAVALWRLHDDKAILVALGIIGAVFLLWFFPVMVFCHKHPDAALLEGAEWTGWQRFQAMAKGYLPSPAERKPLPAPGTPPTDEPQQPKPEQGQ